MSSCVKPVNVARLLATFNFEIEVLPEGLKCAACKSMLRDPCQVPCGCRFCRACIDEVSASGGQMCLGSSDECGETPLSSALPDYSATKSISRLTARCPLAGCSHECPLADMEAHLRACPRQSVDCPFRELGCLQDKMAAEEMDCHLQQESRSHSEILIGLAANVNRDVGMLKRELLLNDEQVKTIMDEMRHLKNEIKSMKIDNKSIQEENKLTKEENKLIKDEIKSVKHENKSIRNENILIKNESRSIKDEIRLIKEENNSIKEENKSIREENKLIKEENNSIKIENKSIKSEFKSIRNENKMQNSSIKKENKSIKTEHQKIKDEIKSIKEEKKDVRPIKAKKSQLQPAQTAAGALGGVDASCEGWLIDDTVGSTGWSIKKSDLFSGATQRYSFQLESANIFSSAATGAATGELWIRVRVHAGPDDALLQWPFRGAVAVTVADRERREAHTSMARQCRVERPPDNDYRWTDPFVFPHAQLGAAGLDLGRGVRVSCRISPDSTP